MVISLRTVRKLCGCGKDTDMDQFEMLADACGTDTNSSVKQALVYPNPVQEVHEPWEKPDYFLKNFT